MNRKDFAKTVGGLILVTATFVGTFAPKVVATENRRPEKVLREARKVDTRINGVGRGENKEYAVIVQPGTTDIKWSGYLNKDNTEIIYADFQLLDTPVGYDCQMAQVGETFTLNCTRKGTAIPPTPSATVIVPPTPTPTPIPGNLPTKTVYLGTSGAHELLTRCTLGFIGYYEKTGERLLVTNAHCLTAVNWKAGLPTYKECIAPDDNSRCEFLSPGPYDKGIKPNDIIGIPYYWWPNVVYDQESLTYDAGTIRIYPDNTVYKIDVKNEIKGLGTVGTTFLYPEMGYRLNKVGATTGLGEVKVVANDICIYMGASLNTTDPIEKAVTLEFCNQAVIQGVKDANGTAHPAMLGGDSGSLFVLKSTTAIKTPVCLGFAGDKTGEYAICSPIESVLKGLHLRLTP